MKMTVMNGRRILAGDGGWRNDDDDDDDDRWMMEVAGEAAGITYPCDLAPAYGDG